MRRQVPVAGAMRKKSVMAQNADAFVDVVGLLARDSRHDMAAAGAAEPAAPAVLDCRTALLAPEDARRLPTWQPLSALLEACRDDPARFQEEVLGRTLWSKQVEVCEAMARSPITVVPAGRAVGKSFLLAGTVLWWLYTRPGSLVITTGPDHRQVVSVLWKEIRRALRPRSTPRAAARLILGYDHLTEGYNSPQRLDGQEGDRLGCAGLRGAVRGRLQRAACRRPARDRRRGQRGHAADLVGDSRPGRDAAGGGRQPDPLRLPLPRAPRPGREGLETRSRRSASRASSRPTPARISRRWAWRRSRS